MERSSEFSTRGSRRGDVEIAPLYTPTTEEQLRSARDAASGYMKHLKAVEAELADFGIHKPRSKGSQFSKKLETLIDRGAINNPQARALADEYLRTARRFGSVTEELARLGKILKSNRTGPRDSAVEALERFKRAATHVLTESQLREVWRLVDEERESEGKA